MACPEADTHDGPLRGHKRTLCLAADLVTLQGKLLLAALREALCQECDELRLGVPGLCLGEAGVGAGKRCKWLINKPLESPSPD